MTRRRLRVGLGTLQHGLEVQLQLVRKGQTYLSSLLNAWTQRVFTALREYSQDRASKAARKTLGGQHERLSKMRRAMEEWRECLASIKQGRASCERRILRIGMGRWHQRILVLQQKRVASEVSCDYHQTRALHKGLSRWRVTHDLRRMQRSVISSWRGKQSIHPAHPLRSSLLLLRLNRSRCPPNLLRWAETSFAAGP